MARNKQKPLAKKRYATITVLVLLVLALAAWDLSRTNIPVLEPAGPLAHQERNLIALATGLMLIVVIPVFILTFTIAWRYRETNRHKAKYSPNFDHSRVFESIWWLVPSLLIAVLATVAWNASHTLDPYRPLVSKQQPLTVQVVALDWKWLFIYPEAQVASVNLLEFPANTPLDLHITADAPMNSFWVPQLSGQVYAMPGMDTQLHMAASRTGNFYGESANISGRGFAGMHFTARAVSAEQYEAWLKQARSSMQSLSWTNYERLAQPSQDNTVAYYKNPATDLFNRIIIQYMTPATSGANL